MSTLRLWCKLKTTVLWIVASIVTMELHLGGKVKIWLYDRILEILKNQNHIISELETINKRGIKMAGELDLLKTEIADTRGAVDSAIVLINGLSAFLKDHAYDPTAILQMVADLDKEKTDLAAAVVANPIPAP